MAGCGCGGAVAPPSVAELLRTTPLYAYLSDEELPVAADAFTHSRIASGKPLPDSPLYIVLSGEIEVLQGAVRRPCLAWAKTKGMVEICALWLDNHGGRGHRCAPTTSCKLIPLLDTQALVLVDLVSESFSSGHGSSNMAGRCTIGNNYFEEILKQSCDTPSLTLPAISQSSYWGFRNCHFKFLF